MKNIMIDLETMGTSSNAAICAIGAVEFDIEKGILGREFYAIVNLKSAVEAGGVIDAETVKWWLKQSDAARQELLKLSLHIDTALQMFTEWLYASETEIKSICVWGNGADFDNVILRNAFDRLHVPAPWSTWNNRCYRTIKSMQPSLKIQRAGTHHRADDDARDQAQHLIKLMQVSQ